MPNRNLWLIDMGDGTWAVCCLACRLALYRGPKRTANQVFTGHRCEPSSPSAADPGQPNQPGTLGGRREPRNRSPTTSTHTSTQGAAS
jgi:hypothetical protein